MELNLTAMSNEWQGLSKQEQQQHLFDKQKSVLDALRHQSAHTDGSYGHKRRDIRKPLCRGGRAVIFCVKQYEVWWGFLPDVDCRREWMPRRRQRNSCRSKGIADPARYVGRRIGDSRKLR